MSAGRNITDNNTEDIDLLLLLERLLAFGKKYSRVFILAIVLGLATGFFFYRIIPTTYQSRLVLHSFVLTNPEQLQIVNNWDKLLKQKEYETLASLLHCRKELLNGVKQLKAKEIQQAFTPSNPNGFTIDVLVTNNNLLDSLQPALVYGFENSEYIKEKLEARRTVMRELIVKTTHEIARLDSTKKIIENIIAGNGRSSSPLLLDGSGSNKQLIEMNEKLLGFKETLQFTNAVQVLQSFSKFNKPDGPKLLPWLLIGALAFTCIAWAGAVLHSINKKLVLRKKNHQPLIH